MHFPDRRQKVEARLGLSLFGNGRLLAAKDILLDPASGCFWQLGYEVNFLWRLEVCQLITSVIAQLGTFQSSSPWMNSTGERQFVMLSGSEFIERKPLMMRPCTSLRSVLFRCFPDVGCEHRGATRIGK